MSQAKPNREPTRKPFSSKFTELQPDGKYVPVVIRHHEYRDKNMSIKDIEKLAIDLRKKFIAKDKGAQVQLVIETPFGDRSGKFHRGGEYRNIQENEIHVWNPNLYEYDSLKDNNNERIKWYDNGKVKPKAFWFNVIYTSNRGGADPHNDCLYNCLKQLLGDKFTDLWKYPSKLKKNLKLGREDMVNANEHIDIIEKRLKVQICITGDVSRIPRIETKLKVNLFLQNSHFSIEPSSKKPAVKGVSWQDRKPITYHYNKDTYDYTLYDGEKEYTETEAKVWQMNRVSGASVLIKVAKKEKLQLEYNTFIDQADKLKVESKGLINMYKSGTIKATALQLFSDFTKAVEQPDSIKGIEGEWILDCYRGGLLDATPYEGKAYKYDVSSMYPYIMNNMRFAYKEGELKLLTQEEMSKWIDKKTGKQYFKYGMYRAVISGDIKKPVFRANVLNRFTHIDMDTAFKEGYTIALIEDGGCNFIYYPESSRISGKELFKKYFEVLYPIKAKHVKEIPALNYSYAKSLMNILWGALAEKRIYQKIYTGMYDDKEVRPLGVNEKITNTVFLGNGKIICSDRLLHMSPFYFPHVY
jgi:hypothetical protein